MPTIFKLSVGNLHDADHAKRIVEHLQQMPGIMRVDVNASKGLLRVVAAADVVFTQVEQRLQSIGVVATLFASPDIGEHPSQKLEVRIAGMHCRSCELLVEREFKQLPGVQKVQVNADRGYARLTCDAAILPSRTTLNSVIEKHGYKVAAKQIQSEGLPETERPRFGQLLGIFALVFVIGFILSKTGLLRFNADVGNSTGLLAIFFLGLVAATSSCLAVSGGLMLSVVANFRERYNLQGRARLIPTVSFVAGRIIGYAVLGGVIAGIGKVLSPSPLFTAVITIIAALYMFIMGLDMLRLAPSWLKAILPRMPKALGHRVMDSNKNVHWFSPFLLGALTFFLPCGFTQSLQLYVLTTGNVLTGALTMFAFALGTAPALLALGWVSHSLKGKAGQFFFRLAGAAVIVLGLYNFSNGLAIAGYPISFSRGSSPETVVQGNVADPNVIFDGTRQNVKTTFTDFGYSPSTFTVKAGVPVHWEVDSAGKAGGCRSSFLVPKLKISESVVNGVSIFDFTPDTPGTYAFSCGMGMYRGSFSVVST
ncbi:MAG: sulfite exporter TauE/SafE family protein [Patescibacteria group bacterium]|jgi:sulfite exporter TauE/SafE/copper chaperone CopZ